MNELPQKGLRVQRLDNPYGYVEVECPEHGFSYTPPGKPARCFTCNAGRRSDEPTPKRKERTMAKKQPPLPGMERKTVAEIDTAAEHYVEQRDKRMRLSEKEHEAKDALIASMRKHNVLSYRDDSAGLVVTLVSKDNVKVTEAEEAKADTDDAEAE